MAGYDGRGARFNIVAVEGNDLSFTVTAVDSDAAAVDLSAATITGTVYNGSGTAIDTLTDAVSGAGSNIITLSFTDAEVDALVDPKSWALVVERGGDARTWLAGSFTVSGSDRARTGTSGTAVTATVDTNVTVAATLTGLTGATGPTGATGAAGADGADGVDGADGADAFDGFPEFNGTVVNGFRGVALRDATGLTVDANGYLVASSPTSAGTGSIWFPLIDPTEPFRFGAIVELGASNDGGTVQIDLGQVSGGSFNVGARWTIRTATGFNVITTGAGGQLQLFSGQTITPGVYECYAVSDGTRVTAGFKPVATSALYSNQINGVAAYTDGKDCFKSESTSALSAFPTTFGAWSRIDRVRVSTSSATHKLRSLFVSVGTNDAPATGVTGFLQFVNFAGVGVGAPADIGAVIRGRSSTPTDVVIVTHPNGADRLTHAEQEAQLALIDAGYMMLYVQGDEVNTLTGKWSSPWCGRDGVAQIKAALDATVAQYPSIRRAYGFGMSMGLSTLLTFEHTYPGVLSGIVGVSGVTDLSYAYSSEGFSSVINTGNTIAALAVPSGVSVTPVGTTGATTYGYRIAAISTHGTTTASASVTTTTGNATLSGSDYNTVSWTAVPGATAYAVYGRTNGSELFMTYTTATSFNDTGAKTPSGALPGSNTSGYTPAAVDDVYDRDPKRRVADLTGVPQKIWFGTADGTLDKTKHADEYVTALTAAGGTVEAVSVAGGGHLDATMWAGVTPADVVAFFAANT